MADCNLLRAVEPFGKAWVVYRPSFSTAFSERSSTVVMESDSSSPLDWMASRLAAAWVTGR